MPNEQIHKNLWIRWAHFSWENENEWRSDISQNILHDETLGEAQFIFDDCSCVFIAFKELRKALSQKAPRENGMITFSLNPRQKTVDGVLVDLTVVESATKRNRERTNYKDVFKNWNPN